MDKLAEDTGFRDLAVELVRDALVDLPLLDEVLPGLLLLVLDGVLLAVLLVMPLLLTPLLLLLELLLTLLLELELEPGPTTERGATRKSTSSSAARRGRLFSATTIISCVACRR